MTRRLDPADSEIIALLQQDARLSPAVIGRRLKLAKVEVETRIAGLEQRGIITGYYARIDPAALGHGISAFIRVTSRGYVTPLEVVASQLPGIIECHSVTGDHDSIVRVVAPDVAALEQIIVELKRCGVTSTSLILSSTVVQKPIPSPA